MIPAPPDTPKNDRNVPPAPPSLVAAPHRPGGRARRLSTACVVLSTWGRHDVRYLHSEFFNGRFDGQREWRGSYLAVYRGQLAYESETIRYTTPPATRPANRWLTEDAVGRRTPALRSFPFDGTLDFHHTNYYSVSPAGSLHVHRIGFPIWAALLLSSPALLYPVVRLIRRRRAEVIAGAQ